MGKHGDNFGETKQSQERRAKILAAHEAKVKKARSNAGKISQQVRAERKEEAEKLTLEQLNASIAEKTAAYKRGEKVKWTPEERDLLNKRLQAAKLQRQRLLKGNELVKFCPNGAQEEVVKLFGASELDVKTPQIIADFAGNGRGKTALLVNLLGNIIWGPQPFIATEGTLDEYTNVDSPVNWVKEWGKPPQTWFSSEIFKKWPYPKNIRIVSTPANLDDEGAIQLEIDKWWPRHRFKGIKGKYDYRSKIKTDTGFSIEMKTFAMSSEEHESKTCGLILVDEPLPQGLWGATLSRFRRGGILLLSMTPLFGSAFLYDEIVQKADGGDTSVRYLFSDVEDNCCIHGTRGILTHEAVEWMVNKYPPEERESRKSGTFLSLSGRVHKDFNRDIHVIPARHDKTDIPTRDFILSNKHLFQFYQVIDPHDRKWDAIGYYALDDRNRKYCIDEYPDRSCSPYHTLSQRRYTYQQLVRDILIPKEQALGLRSDEFVRLMDPRYAKNHSHRGADKSGLTIEQEFTMAYNEGFITNINDNFNACRNKLDNNLIIGTDGHPNIYFYEGYADNHIYAMEHWMWDRWEGKAAEKRDIKETPQERNSDFPRLLHYLTMFDPTYSIRDTRTLGWRDKIKKKQQKKAYSWMAS